MGACSSSPEARRSLEISRKLRHEQKSVGRSPTIKLLLLGAGNAGKSTFLKQFKLMFTSGFTHVERKAKAPLIRESIVNDVLLLVEAVRTLDELRGHEDSVDERVWDIEAALRELCATGQSWISFRGALSIADSAEQLDVAAALLVLWNTVAIQKAYECRGRIGRLEGDVAYWMAQLEKVAVPEYVPSVENVLRLRTRTVGIASLSFNYKEVPLLVIDVGGQRNERRKWIAHFDNVDAIIFVASGAEFDEVLLEDNSKNRMMEALELFESMVHCPHFEKTSFIFFANKTDLVETKVRSGSARLGDFFPAYGGDNSDIQEVKDFIVALFRERWEEIRGTEKSNESSDLFVSWTCATDTDDVAFVLGSCAMVWMRRFIKNEVDFMDVEDANAMLRRGSMGKLMSVFDSKKAKSKAEREDDELRALQEGARLHNKRAQEDQLEEFLSSDSLNIGGSMTRMLRHRKSSSNHVVPA